MGFFPPINQVAVDSHKNIFHNQNVIHSVQLHVKFSRATQLNYLICIQVRGVLNLKSARLWATFTRINRALTFITVHNLESKYKKKKNKCQKKMLAYVPGHQFSVDWIGSIFASHSSISLYPCFQPPPPIQLAVHNWTKSSKWTQLNQDWMQPRRPKRASLAAGHIVSRWCFWWVWLKLAVWGWAN